MRFTISFQQPEMPILLVSFPLMGNFFKFINPIEYNPGDYTVSVDIPISCFERAHAFTLRFGRTEIPNSDKDCLENCGFAVITVKAEDS